MAKYIKDVLIRREQIEEMCRRLGKQISQDYAGREVVFDWGPKGAYVFFCRLARLN